MRMMEVDQVEKVTFMRNHIQRFGGFMTYSEESSKKGISTTSLPVSHHLSFCYYNLEPLLFSFDLGRGFQ